MCNTINDPAKCEVRGVIRFLNARKIRPIEMYRQITEVYGNVMNEATVRKWCIMFNSGRTNVHDGARSGRPSVVTDELKGRIEKKLQEDRRFTIDELHSFFPEISRTLIHDIVSGELGYNKKCKRVPADVSSQLNYKELKPSMNRERTARVREDTLQVAINEGLINNTRTATDVSLDPLLQLKERILVRCRTEDTSVKHIFQDECSRVPFELSSLLTYKALKPLMNNERASRLRDNYQQAAISEGNGSHNEAAHPYDVLPSGGSVQDAASCADDPLATKEESTLPPEMYNVHPEEPPILPPQPKKFKPLSQTDPTNSLPQTVGSQGRHSKFQDASLDSHHFTGQSQEYPHNVHIKSEYDYEDDSVDISSVDNSGAASNTMSEPMVEEPHRTADKRAAEEQDDHDRYGVYVASKLRKMDPVQCVFAENLINQALFKGAINSLREDTTFFNPSSR